MPNTKKNTPVLWYTLEQEPKPVFQPTLKAISELKTTAKDVPAESNDTLSQQLLSTIIRHTDHHKNHFGIQIIRLVVNVLFFFLLGVKQQSQPKNLSINYPKHIKPLSNREYKP